MSLSDEQWEFLKDVAALVKFADHLGYKLTGGELWRTPEQQRRYFESGLSKTMNSKHLQRLAIDINLFIDGKLREDREAFKELAEFWKSLNKKNDCGYFWKWDYGHFERDI